jgi:copper transport protein
MSLLPRALRVVLAVSLFAALSFPAQASAHALLIGADPADGSHLDSSPQRVRLSFSEEISPRFRSLQLVGPNGRAVVGTRLSGAASTLVLDLPRLHKGTYAVDWRVVAEDDGHTTSGTIVFGVGVAAVAGNSTAHEVTPSAAEAGLRWLRFSVLALVFGGIAVAYLVLATAPRGPAADAARRRVLTAAAVGAGLAATAGLASAVRQVWTVSSSAGLDSPRLSLARDVLLSSRWGHLWLLEEVALVILLMVTVAAWRRRAASGMHAALASIWVAVAAVCEALGSHAASVSSAAVVADAAHLLSAALWLGAVAALAVALWPTRAIARDDVRKLVAACRWRFGLLAGAGVIVSALTGLYSAGREVASVDALLTTFYGRVLLAKTAVVVAAAMLGAANAVVLTRVAHGRRSAAATWLIVAETAVGAGAFVGAGVLTASSPARGPQFAPPLMVRAPTLAANVDDVLVSASIRPNRPGENVLSVQVASSRRPPPAPIDSVDARLAGADRTTELRRIDTGRYLATMTLPRAGRSGLSVVVHRAGQALPTRLGWSVEQADPARHVVVSSRRLSSIVDPLALALCAALLVVGLFALLVRHSRAPVWGLSLSREEPS